MSQRRAEQWLSERRELLALRQSARSCLQRVETLTEHLLDAIARDVCPGCDEVSAIVEARKIRVALKRHFDVFPIRGDEPLDVGAP